jgi:hypothetical protein
MQPTHRNLKTLAALAALTLAGAGQATVLTFDGYNAIGQAAYGDRVVDFGTAYGPGGGATPNIVLDYVMDSGFAPSVYGSGYATLTNALGHSGFNQPGYVQLTPDAGYDVVLTSFDVAAWSNSSYPDSRLRVVDTAGTVFLDTEPFIFGPGFVATWPGSARSSLPLRIIVNDFGDLGIDNITFGQVASVPEVSPLVMMLAGLGAVGALTRRRLRRA